MTAINFPDSPTPGQEFTAANRTWTWNDTAQVWESLGVNEFTPSPHATTHEDGGTDEVLIAQTQVDGLATALSGKQAVVTGVDDTEIGYLDGVTSGIQSQLDGKVDEVNGTVTTASTSSTVVRNITLSTSEPTGGADGDVWLAYTA